MIFDALGRLALGEIPAEAGGGGRVSTITGSSVTYARGGAGGSNYSVGEANTGNGGSTGTTAPSGAGGSGIVVIRYFT